MRLLPSTAHSKSPIRGNLWRSWDVPFHVFLSDFDFVSNSIFCTYIFFHGCFPEKLLVGLRPSSQHLKALKKLYVLLDIFHVVFGNLLSEF